MKHIRTYVHPGLGHLDQQSIFQRRATRAIVLNGESILLLYTERYNDYTLPGGGLDEDEDLIAGMVRELQEETGAQDIRNIEPFGLYEEFLPWQKNNATVMHQLSYCYSCEIADELGETSFESHEINNGMKPVWINIYQAIEHNENTMANHAKKGISIERETFLLHAIAKERLAKRTETKARK